MLFGITMGDSSGIGPEIILKAFKNGELRHPVAVYGDRSVLEHYNQLLGIDAPLGEMNIVDHGLLRHDQIQVGQLSRDSGHAAREYVISATKAALAGKITAMVTLPMNKEATQLSDPQFVGHTELIGALCGSDDVTIMLVSDDLIVTHVSTHCSLSDAIQRCKKERICTILQLTNDALHRLMPSPRIAVAGLNPHAGENGLFGREEIEEIGPAVAWAQAQGMPVEGPFPPDTLFYMAVRKKKYDAIVCMYHDQGHVPLKLLDFENGVNVALGLPIIRTSVDHGTAFDIAGKGIRLHKEPPQRPGFRGSHGLMTRLARLLVFLPIGIAGAQPGPFATTLYPILEKAQCRLCHNDNGVASATRLQFPPESSSAAEIERFGLRLRVLVDPAHPDQSLLLRKPTNRAQHTGGERIHPGSDQERVLKAWVEHLATAPEAVATVGAGTQQTVSTLRRLTHSQYNHTVQDLLGDQTRPADQFPNEDYVHGFTNQAEAQSISPLLAEAYNHAAERLARNAFRGGDSHGLIPCKPADPGCRQQFIRQFGRRAFRRPLTDRELRVYEKLFESQRDFLPAAQVVVEAMLQSPHFLFQLASGPYGVASRLSYFLWDTMPDNELFHAAESGALTTTGGIDRQATRLLADARARDSFDEFLSQWLRFDRLRTAVRDRKLFPEFSSELVNSMTEEVRLLFGHLLWDDGNFLDFFRGDSAFLNSDLAKLYDVPAPAQEFGLVKFQNQSGRAGILGSALFLSLTSKPSETSPTERGIFVREHFLCQIIPPPPPGVNTNLPEFKDDKPLTNREKLAMHLTDPTCAACHNLVDSIGFGMEHYDAIGRFRSTQQVAASAKVVHELTIDASASVRGVANSTFSSPRELGIILANTPACQRCIVKQLYRYALGRPETSADQDAIEALWKDFQASGFHYRNLILSIVRSRSFLGDLPPGDLPK